MTSLAARRNNMRQGDEQERAALQAAAAAIYPSHWARKSAVTHYGADPAKVHVVPFGGESRGKTLSDGQVLGRQPIVEDDESAVHRPLNGGGRDCQR